MKKEISIGVDCLFVFMSSWFNSLRIKIGGICILPHCLWLISGRLHLL
jgi:hypothetical protein